MVGSEIPPQMTFRYLISGRVQGVGFRRFAYARARELGIVGWVRNLRDGRVEVLANADQSRLDKFIQELHRGPQGSIVDKVVENKVTQSLRSRTFEQVEDGDEPWQENF